MVIAVKLEFLYKEIVTRREYNERKYKILSNKNILVWNRVKSNEILSTYASIPKIKEHVQWRKGIYNFAMLYVSLE